LSEKITEKAPSSQHTVASTVEKIPAFEDKLPYILFLTGTLVGKKILLNETVTSIGRSRSCAVVVHDTRVSRCHIEIVLDKRGALLRDVASTNGTLVNGKQVRRRRLQDGDKIQLSSNTLLKFVLHDKTETDFHDELYNMAVHDAVTTLHNRRYLLKRLKEEFRHAREEEKLFSLLMIDIDLFKTVNDTYGHVAGDVALRHVALTLQDMIRGQDLAGRYGGEEFVVLLPGTGELGALQLAERIRMRVEREKIQFEEVEISLTISIGVATLTPEMPYESPRSFIQAADSCLYASKQGGRNRTTCVSHSDETWLDNPP